MTLKIYTQNLAFISKESCKVFLSQKNPLKVIANLALIEDPKLWYHAHGNLTVLSSLISYHNKAGWWKLVWYISKKEIFVLLINETMYIKNWIRVFNFLVHQLQYHKFKKMMQCIKNCQKSRNFTHIPGHLRAPRKDSQFSC